MLWCFLEGAIAAGLLLAGGLIAIQMASIIIGLPIAFFLLINGYSLVRSLRADTMTTAKGQVMGPTANDPIVDSYGVKQGGFSAMMSSREIA
ncbi:choline transport protein BetT [compost metagenome]